MENQPVQRRQLPVVLQGIGLLLWGFLCALMLLSAIIGLGCVLLGMLSLFVDLSRLLDMQLGSASVRTTTQKVLFAVVGAVMASTGIGFWWLNRRGYIAGALICCTVLMGLFLAIAWATGRADVISVGGA
jgi:hypothetical protein